MITFNLVVLSLITLGLLRAVLTDALESEQNLRLDGGEELGWDISNWFVTVDGVMGGKSDGELVYTKDNTVLSFSGDIVLDGGGFSSVRKQLPVVTDLTPYAGVVVELEPHAYTPAKAPLGMHLQFHDEPSRYGYAAAFAVPMADPDKNVTTTSVYIPLEDFDRATRIGFLCRDKSRCTMDPTRINEMDLYVLFQEGPFRVDVHSITAVRNATSFPSPKVNLTSSDQVRDLIQATIDSGAGVYNYGYMEICNAVYRSTLNTLLASVGGGVTDEMKAQICEGLQRAADQETKVDTAWSLRATLDAVWDMASIVDPNAAPISRSVVNATWEEECMAVTSHPPVYVDANSTHETTAVDVQRMGSPSHNANEKMALMGEDLLISSAASKTNLVWGATLGLILHSLALVLVA